MSEDERLRVSPLAAMFSSLIPLTDDELEAHFSSQKPTRVAILVRGNSEHRAESPLVIIKHVLSMLEMTGHEPLYLALEDWGRTVHIVFDLFHASYDFDKADSPHDMTVIMVSLGKRHERKWFAPSELERQVNEEIAHLHNLNGWDTRPPFVASHANGAIPSYANPRHLTRAAKDGEQDEPTTRV